MSFLFTLDSSVKHRVAISKLMLLRSDEECIPTVSRNRWVFGVAAGTCIQGLTKGLTKFGEENSMYPLV